MTSPRQTGALHSRGRPRLAWESLGYKKKSRGRGRDFPERKYREAKVEDGALGEKKEGPREKSGNKARKNHKRT